jgi:hypothetical protein
MIIEDSGIARRSNVILVLPRLNALQRDRMNRIAGTWAKRRPRRYLGGSVVGEPFGLAA